MNLLKISWSNLKDKPLTSFLSILLMALGIAIISLLLLAGKQLEEKFTRNVAGIDMVVGAKGSPLQLILASIYQIDAPTGNISLDETNRLTRNPLVKSAIPLSMGDSYQGYRIVGSNEKYLQHFEAEYESGKVFSEPMEMVLGAKVAKNLELKVGDTFASQHGYDKEGDVHEEKKFKVVGILKNTNSVLDQLMVTPLESVWAVHDEHHEEEVGKGANALKLLEEDTSPTTDDGHHHEEESKEITSMLIKFRNPAMGMMMARSINQNTTMQTASPAIEINRLFALMGFGIDTLKIIALVIIIVSGLSVFVSLYNSLKERKYEMALMLSMGASRTKLFFLLLLEGLIISSIGFVIGIALSRLGLWLMSKNVEQNFHYDFNVLSLLTEELWLFIGALVIGLLAAAIPSLGIYKIDISRTLADE
ncbi:MULTISPECIES: ABC transporter permease [unclassified Arcicella]|uniref:ABC transporter permease n=1 Tax=unclassified Arcicella TaxID=2644986 RepID=UPI002865E768|nr:MULTISPECIES: ABC transporter permease [unclassified Arcicella]MDR6564737.1 putative ABC transport system permease protein [Arcicella sp. BE51]MDR6814533.1 putative ABC transport system permease protein [Arcicella sp. BE140]MDR6825879.1 putative ABC transport system permease protein [Arcicella sp. BE139]